MEQYPSILEPLLFYILHRANHVITNREITHVFKAFFIDEAWTFFRNARIKGYIVEALKTWRKQNAAMILSTQSLDELRKSDIVDVGRQTGKRPHQRSMRRGENLDPAITCDGDEASVG